MMDKNIWKTWGKRLKALAKEKGLNLAALAEKLGLAESTVRSWTNGTHNTTLKDFFLLCAAADLDPALVLFGMPIMNPEQRKKIGELAVSILEADPTSSPDYRKMAASFKNAAGKRRRADKETA